MAGPPPWLLYEAAKGLTVDQLTKLGERSEPMKSFVESQALWKGMYLSHYPAFRFCTDIGIPGGNWRSRYVNRYKAMDSIKSGKPRVESFRNKIRKLRALSNAFAFSTDKGISLVVFDYADDTRVQYKTLFTTPIEADDFVFDENTILAVRNEGLFRVDVSAPTQVIQMPMAVGRDPKLHVLDRNTYVVASHGVCSLVDIRDPEPKLRFEHSEGVTATGHQGLNFYIGSRNSVTCQDLRTGMIAWNFPGEAEFCHFDIPGNRALFGSAIVSLIDGKGAGALPMVGARCGSISSGVAVVGCERELIFARVDGSGEPEKVDFYDEEVRCVRAARNCVAVAGEYGIRIFSVSDKGNVELIRNVVGGSIAQRKAGSIPVVEDIVFDGERLLVNNQTFVRVYDFYGGLKEAAK